MGILVFLLAITLVVVLHEFGHYVACRAFKIPVNKFAVGVGKPLLKRTDKRGTEWSLRPFPLGGFVQPNASAMQSASPLKKFIVAVAGPLANLGPLGVLAALNGTFILYLSGLWEIYAGGFVGLFQTLTFGIFSSPIHAGATTTTGGLTGPIGIGASAVQMNNESGPLVAFLMLFFMLNLGLGLINLLPVPLFDGGRAVFAGVEAAVGQPRSRRIEKVANLVGLVIIVALVLIVTTHDFVSLFR